MLKEFAINFTIVSLALQRGETGGRVPMELAWVTQPQDGRSLAQPHTTLPAASQSVGVTRGVGWVGHTADRREVRTQAERNQPLFG